MSFSAKYIPLSFIAKDAEIFKQIINTIIIKSFIDDKCSTTTLEYYIQGTQYGYNDSAKNDGRNKFLRISDITDGMVDWDSVPFCDCKDESTYLLEDNDIVIARTGGTTGKSFMIVNPPKSSIYAGYLIRVRAKKDVNPVFLQCFFNSYLYWNQIVSLNSGEFRPSINSKKLAALEMPLFSQHIQNLIVKLCQEEISEEYATIKNTTDKFRQSFEHIKAIHSEIAIQKETVSQLKQTILQNAIQGKLTAEWRKEHPAEEAASELLKRIKLEKQQMIASGKLKKEKPLEPIKPEEIPFEIPESWTWGRWGELSESIQYGYNAPAQENGRILMIRISDIQNNTIIWDKVPYCQIPENEINNYLIKKNDILFARTGGTVGKSYLVTDEPCSAIYAGYLIRTRYSSSLEPKFLKSFMESELYWSQLTNGTRGAAQPNCNGQTLSKMILPIPPLSEQQEIVRRIDAIMNTVNSLENQISESERTSEELLKAIVGEVMG